MDKQPVGTLPDLTASSLDDEIMIITEADTSQLRKEKISNILTDIISVQEDNALTKGTDGKMFVTDFGNASNITEGTLPVDVLPESGVTADTYAYPSSVTVNAQGQVTAIEEGTPSGANADTDLSNLTEEGEKHFLNKTQITNCILEAPNGVATYSGSTITVKAGLKVLIPNKRNNDKTLNNIEYTLQSDVSVSLPSDRNGVEFITLTNNGELSYWNTNDVGYIYKEPQSNLSWKYYDEDDNIYKYTINGASYVDSLEVPVLLANVTNGVITSLAPYQPVELIKRTDPQIQAPYITETYVNGTEGYILFSNNFSIQWGRMYAQNGGAPTYYVVNLLLEMADTNYSCLHSLFSLSTGFAGTIDGTYLQAWNLTTTSFTTGRFNNNQINTTWVVLGYVA